MAANKEYSRKSDAVRAAKKEFGENWADSVEIITRSTPDGDRFVYDFPRSAPDAGTISEAAAEVLKAHADEIAQMAQKKAQLMKNKPVHTPATPSPAPSEGMDEDQAQSPDHEAVAEAAAVPAPSPAEAQKQGDKIADAMTANVDPLKPRISTAEKPTKLVWAIADEMPGKSRKEVIEECVKRGIAFGTARTQYQHWFKTKNDSAAAPKAQHKDGRVLPPASTVKH